MTTTEVNINRMAWVGLSASGFAVDDLSHWRVEDVQRKTDDPLIAKTKPMLVVYFKSGGLLYLDITVEEFHKAITGVPFKEN